MDAAFIGRRLSNTEMAEFYERPRVYGAEDIPVSGDGQRGAIREDSTRCMMCGVELTSDDIGLHKKLVNRGAKVFCCKVCLAKQFKITTEQCDVLIAHYRAAGCSLFC